jgi:hypothetical protein
MMDVNTSLSKTIEGFIPTVCTESPAPGIYSPTNCFRVSLISFLLQEKHFALLIATRLKVWDIPQNFVPF